MFKLFSPTAAVFSFALFFPVIALVYEAFWVGASDADTTFRDLVDTVLLDYVINSILVTLGTVIFALLFAVGPAWWCARYHFSGRRIIQWAMVFPLAIPAYISAYIYTDALDYAGPVQTTLRQWFGWTSPQDYWFFDIRSIIGASALLGLSLYPYLFLLLRFNFEHQSEHLAQAARLMGASTKQIFFDIRLKLARPALAIGCTLIAMESIADFGTVQLFAISTLTTAIYDSWLVYGSLTTAAKISCLLLLFIIALVSLERWQRRHQKQFESKSSQTIQRQQPSKLAAWLIPIFCAVIILLGFIIPVLALTDYTLLYWSENLQTQFWQHAKNTFLLAFIAASIATLVALYLNRQLRFFATPLNRIQQQLASLGYAIPGTVLAIAILIPLAGMDLWINDVWLALGGEQLGLVLSGTSFALVLAFVIRFAAIANGSIESGYQQMSPSLDLAGKSLGSSRNGIFYRIHLPILTPVTLSASLLVFIECVKELPAALLLRPFDFETLSTFVYQYASDEQLEHVASASLLIIIVSLLPILFISRTQKMS